MYLSIYTEVHLVSYVQWGMSCKVPSLDQLVGHLAADSVIGPTGSYHSAVRLVLGFVQVGGVSLGFVCGSMLDV